MKKPKKKYPGRKYKSRDAPASCPCPKCGKPSRVLRTTRGARLKQASRDHVLRERRCIGQARHRFTTEERPR